MAFLLPTIRVYISYVRYIIYSPYNNNWINVWKFKVKIYRSCLKFPPKHAFLTVETINFDLIIF